MAMDNFAENVRDKSPPVTDPEALAVALSNVGTMSPRLRKLYDDAAALLRAQAADGHIYTQADLLEAVRTERHACSIAVWMTLQDALAEGADDKGLDGWMREAEARVKGRLAGRPEHPAPAKRSPMTAREIEDHIGPDEGDREAVEALVREVEVWHGITPTAVTECADNDSPWLVCKTCAAVGRCAKRP